jgi:response regulator NasT
LENAVIVSNAESSTAFLHDLIKPEFCASINVCESCAAARELLAKQTIDLCVINAPLSDEGGDRLAREAAESGRCQVVLIVKAETAEQISATLEDQGVITVSKPMRRETLYTAFKFLCVINKKMQRLMTENSRLTKKLDDIRMTARAKLVLISHLNMTEAEAHRYIEKQAMDLRVTRRVVAEGILKTYEM